MTDKQREVLNILNKNNMQSRPFWVPMHQLRMFEEDIYYTLHNRADEVYKRCLSIPCSTNITDDDLAAVVSKIKEVF